MPLGGSPQVLRLSLNWSYATTDDKSSPLPKENANSDLYRAERLTAVLQERAATTRRGAPPVKAAAQALSASTPKSSRILLTLTGLPKQGTSGYSDASSASSPNPVMNAMRSASSG